VLDVKQFALAAALAAIVAAAAPAASAAIVNVDASVTACTYGYCSGGHPQPGAFIPDLFSPAQLTLDAGTYTITNGHGEAGANPSFDAWNFNTSSDQNWVWAFIMADDATHLVLLDSIGAGQTPYIGNHADAAASGAGYSASFTLAAKTTLDFVTEDYFPYDNAGGVALKIEPAAPTGGVPEPAAWALMIAGFGLAGAGLRRQAAARIAA
jgi:hypothetical protein